MKSISNTNKSAIGIATLAIAFVAIMVAFPTKASANYGRPIAYCSYPQVASIASNGYYYCTLPTQQTPSYPQPYPQPYPVPVPVPQYPQLTASCFASQSSAPTGGQVVWTASVSGGNGSYSYNWSGTDNLSGSGQTVYKTYYSIGPKTATVSVYSGGQATTAYCSTSVNIYDAYYPQATSYSYYNSYAYQTPQYVVQPVGTNAGLDIGCYADPGSVALNQPVTWNVEVTGGSAPYSYSWTGSDGLAGSQASMIKYYSTSGEKSAIVSVTSADGKTGTRSCSNTVTVKSAPTYRAPATPTQPPATGGPSEGNNLAAASLFSLSNVPWGWVAVLVILVLFFTVVYLIYNRPKI